MDYANGGSGTYWGAKEDRPVNDSRVTPDEGPEQGPTEPQKPLPKININLTQEVVYDKNGLLLGYGDDGLERKKQLEKINYAKMIAEKSSDCAFTLNLVSMGAAYIGCLPAVELCGLGATALDIVSFVAFTIDGDKKSAVSSGIGVVIDLLPILAVPLKVEFNEPAKRFIDSTTKRFIKTESGLSKIYTPTVIGITTYAFSYANYENEEDK